MLPRHVLCIPRLALFIIHTSVFPVCPSAAFSPFSPPPPPPPPPSRPPPHHTGPQPRHGGAAADTHDALHVRAGTHGVGSGGDGGDGQGDGRARREGIGGVEGPGVAPGLREARGATGRRRVGRRRVAGRPGGARGRGRRGGDGQVGDVGVEGGRGGTLWGRRVSWWVGWLDLDVPRWRAAGRGRRSPWAQTRPRWGS